MPITKCATFFHGGIETILYARDNDIEVAARQFVPNGVPFNIISIEDLPSRQTRNEWRFNYDNPTGFGER